MEASFFAQAAKFLREKRQNKRWMAIFLCSAILVAGVTVAALRLYGQAMTHQVKTLECSAEVHEHVEECYDEDGNLICGYSDYLIHVHNDDCYDVNGELVCPLPEIKPHEHTEECYQEQRVLTCGQEETAGHQHDGTCYAMGENVLTCTLEEHTHGDSCYSQEKVLVCGKEESEEHVHTEECYALERGALTCGMEEHTHNENCYGQAEELVCGLEEGAGGHTHTDACYGVERVLVCGEDETVLHTHGEDCFDEEGNLICGLVQLEEHVHGEGCFRIMELTNEEIEILNKNSQTSGGEKVCEGEGYVVTATYGADANIPEGAELKAELITPEEDPEHYAQREEEFQQTLGDEEVAMSALFRIGFYVDGEEIEPRSAVTVTVQFLDENGLADGEPITVVHFAEEGTEVLDGSDAEDNSTTFEMESFSEIAIGRRGMGKVVEISEDFAYADEEFQITFHIEGKARLAAETASGTEAVFGSGDGQEQGTAPETGDQTETEDGTGAEGAGETVEEAGDLPDAAGQEAEAVEAAEVPKAAAGMGNDAAEEAGSEEDVSWDEEESADEAQEEDAGAAQDPETGDQTPVAGVQQVPASGDPAFLLEVAQLDESSQEFAAISRCAQELEGEGSEPFLLRGISLSLTHEGQDVPLKNCQITAEISPAEALVRQAEDVSENEEEQNDIRVRIFGLQEDNRVEQLDNMLVNEGESQAAVSLDAGIMGMSASEIANVNFTVQYYADIQVVDKGQNGTVPSGIALSVIDTSNGGTNSGGILPQNGSTPPTTNIYIDNTEGSEDKGSVIHINSLEEIYTEKACDIATYPLLKNFNKFDNEAVIDGETTQVRESNYDVKEIWLLRDGCEPDSVDPEDWEVYPYSKETDEPKFTNDAELKDDGYIVLKEGSVIRLVGEPKKTLYNNSAMFYDFDISDGKVYKDTNGTLGNRNSTGTLYAYTNAQGINSVSNYGNQSGPKYAFGNGNAGNTSQQDNVYNNAYINKANTNYNGETGRNVGYMKCSFGLVAGELGTDGYPNFNMAAPDIFGETPLIGKTYVPGLSLDFDKNGDTYTLTGVNGTNTTGLDKFQRVFADKDWKGDYKEIWSNQFWPMDSSSTWGADGHDLKFGDASKEGKRKFKTGNLPPSDDKADHNSYFGMSFSVDFQLTDDYVGPLNYYFFGDDDMWVFLDGQLVCDIGGVHSSVGEYVDLWDYIAKGSPESAGTHTLSFFYTERGASGSSCWMQFTLPSASSRPVVEPPGGFKSTLTVRKAVTGEMVNTDQAFEFTLQLKGVDGNGLANYYDCDILDSDNQVIRREQIKNGENFFLKNGESIVVRNLPEGITYTIAEKKYGDYDPEISSDTGKIIADGMSEGKIDYKVDDVVGYNNVVIEYALPETGGIGTTTIRIAALLQIMIAAALLGYKQTRRRKGGMGR